MGGGEGGEEEVIKEKGGWGVDIMMEFISNSQ